MHQGIGLDAFNELSQHKAVHALYECCYSVALAGDLADARPYAGHDALFRRADTLLFSLPEAAIDRILDAYPHIGRRPRSARSQAEQCSIWDDDPAVMARLSAAANGYADHFGFGFVMCVGGCSPAEVLTAIDDRMHHDEETERKVVRNELAKINRTRLERMLGPEGGFQNW